MSGERVRLWRQRLIRFSLGAGGTVAFAVLGIVRNKWLAQHLATAGLGTLAQILAAQNWLGQATGLGLGLPVTRAVASARARQDLEAERGTVRTALMMASVAVLVVAAAGFLAAPLLSRALLGTAEHARLVRIALIGVAGIAFSGSVQGLFAGHADVRAPITLALGGGIIATALTLILVPRFGLPGAALGATVLFPAGVALALWIHRREYRGPLAPGGAARIDPAHARQLLSVGAATLLLALTDQGTLLVLRAHYVHENGVAANGLLQAALALAQQVGALFYAYLSSYAFGTISAAAGGAHDAAAAVRDYTRRHWVPLLTLATLAMALAMTGAAPLLRLLYSSRFDPARPLLAWTLLGEFGRVGMQVWMLGALPLGGVRLYTPIALSYPVTLVASYAALHAAGSGGQSLPKAYAAAGLVAFLVAGWTMSRRGVTLGARELATTLLGGGALCALAWWVLH
jgi:hypothetical protein